MVMRVTGNWGAIMGRGIQAVRPWSIPLLVAIMSCSISGLVTADHPQHKVEQRADLWGYPLYNAWVPYRKEMNRPRYIGGYIAHKIEPTSQEAMSWCEHHANGSYHCHKPGYVKMYYYRKPWEVLPIDPRPAVMVKPNSDPASSNPASSNPASSDPADNESPVTVPSKY